ncbi:MAG: hypothetical protein DMG23_05855 [Acidobacteria bacterium]|nr:MAG: hypothetical protein DMG23_05855 [Acidobacteriota bacterium]
MLSKIHELRISLFALVFVIISALPVFAGSAVVGSVAGSMNATIGGQALLPNTTIFSGDSLQVNDGVAVVAIDNTSRMVFGRETTVSFLRGADEVTVLLSRGNLSMYHPEDGVGLRVKVGEVSIVPAQGFKTLGEVAMMDGSVLVTAKEGMLRVEGNGPAQEVAKGKAITIGVKADRAAKASPAAKPLGGGGDVSTALQVGAIGASGAAAVLAGLAISRASDARDAAAAANATAAQALAAANTAAANSSTICNAVVSPSTPCK